MKKQTKSKSKVVKELAGHFEEDLKSSLPIAIQPDGSIVYKDYVVKLKKNQNWGLYDRRNNSLVEEYYLKTCALMAAKAYNRTQLEKFFEIKRLDNRYWANYCDSMIYRKNIKTAKEFERYCILLNKLEASEEQTKHFKEEISRMFKWSFV